MTQHRANRDLECADCGTTVMEGDPVYFNDDGRLCEGCGTAAGVKCPGCGGQKKVEFTTCWGCSGRETTVERRDQKVEKRFKVTVGGKKK